MEIILELEVVVVEIIEEEEEEEEEGATGDLLIRPQWNAIIVTS